MAAVMVLQPSLLALAEPNPVVGALRPTERIVLADGAWVDLRRQWVTGADALFEVLRGSVPWRAERRRMYDRVVDVPRLQHFYGEGDPLPHPTLAAARRALSAHYGPVLGEPLRTVGCCLYRDGTDSVAWHGDTIGRAAHEDTVVAVVSLGATRRFLLRPRQGGHARRVDLASGDLLVMGGSCQRTWEHAVPKTARPTGPRMSVQFRASGVR
jgi:alkylated DNA repair dioxygenase AlkB